MDFNSLTLKDWLPLLIGLAGIVAGAILTELRALIAGSRERRRALNVLLYELLQLRFEIKTSNPRTVLEAISRIAERKYGAGVAQGLKDPAFVVLISKVFIEAGFSDTSKLAERYETAVRALVPFEPLLAYRLSGNERLAKLERVIGTYYREVSQMPSVVSDPNAPALLPIVANATTQILVEEVMRELATDVMIVARARAWPVLRWVWIPLVTSIRLRRQDRVATERLDRKLEELLEKVVPQIINAMPVVAAPASAAALGVQGIG